MNENNENIINSEFLLQNIKQINNFRTIMGIIIGSICGILGINGFFGFLIFILLSLIGSIAIIAFKMKFNSKDFILKKNINFIIDGFTEQLLTFILFWTLLYGLIHLY